MLWLWALLSLDNADVQRALDMAKHTERMAAQEIKALRSRHGAGSWFSGGGSSSGSSTSGVDATMIFYEVMESECMLLAATLHVIGGGVMDRLRAGITMRTVWLRYNRIAKLIAAAKTAEADSVVHSETLAAIEFGVGVFNLVGSILPPRILAVAKVLGFPTSRGVGIDNLKASFHRGGVIAPIAGMALMMHHTFLQSTYDFGAEVYARDAAHALQVAAERYPDSGWFYMMRGQGPLGPRASSLAAALTWTSNGVVVRDFLYLLGRFERLRRNTELSLDAFVRAKEKQVEWKPLVDMCVGDEHWGGREGGGE
jgi:hypothetical protein